MESNKHPNQIAPVKRNMENNMHPNQIVTIKRPLNIIPKLMGKKG